MKLADQIAKNIKRFREERGFTQLQLGEKVGVSRATIIRWEDDGAAKMAVEEITKLAAALRVGELELITGAAPKAAPDMAIQLSPVFYEHLLTLSRLEPSDREHVLRIARIRSGDIPGDESKRGSGTDRA